MPGYREEVKVKRVLLIGLVIGLVIGLIINGCSQLVTTPELVRPRRHHLSLQHHPPRHRHRVLPRYVSVVSLH